MDQLTDYLRTQDIPYIFEDQFIFTCGFVFYPFEDGIACNNPKGAQFLDLTVSDAERLIKRQVRKVPTSLHKPFYKQ